MDNEWRLESIKKTEDIEIIFSRGSSLIYYNMFKVSKDFKKIELYKKDHSQDQFNLSLSDIAFNRSFGKINSVYE